jgi:hypothetical protein
MRRASLGQNCLAMARMGDESRERRNWRFWTSAARCCASAGNRSNGSALCATCRPATRPIPSGCCTSASPFARGAPGLWLRMTLTDGEELEGLAANDRSLIDGAGLLAHPARHALEHAANLCAAAGHSNAGSGEPHRGGRAQAELRPPAGQPGSRSCFRRNRMDCRRAEFAPSALCAALRVLIPVQFLR